MKVFVAIPSYDRKICCETARALLDEQGAAAMSGIDMVTGFVPGTAYVHQARDICAREFLASDADRVVFIDADVSWAPGSVVKIATSPHDFVGGAYRFKREPEGYPVEWIVERPQLLSDPETHCIEVAALPGGFLSLSRAVFAGMLAAHPERAYSHEGHPLFGFWHCPPGAGEDGTFCEEWRALGGRVWLEPTLTLTHVDGGRAYTGCIGDWLRSRMKEVA